MLIYEPTLDKPDFQGSEVTHDLSEFKARTSIIVANRWDNNLANVGAKSTHAIYSAETEHPLKRCRLIKNSNRDPILGGY